MSTSNRPYPSSTTGNPTTSNPNAPQRSYFEQQRELLLREIGVSFEHVLSNINKLNRSLEGVIAVGNEFSSVEALWSRFEGVMDDGNEREKEEAGKEEKDEGDESMVSRHEGGDAISQGNGEGGDDEEQEEREGERFGRRR